MCPEDDQVDVIFLDFMQYIRSNIPFFDNDLGWHLGECLLQFSAMLQILDFRLLFSDGPCCWQYHRIYTRWTDVQDEQVRAIAFGNFLNERNSSLSSWRKISAKQNL